MLHLDVALVPQEVLDFVDGLPIYVVEVASILLGRDVRKEISDKLIIIPTLAEDFGNSFNLLEFFKPGLVICSQAGDVLP